MIDSIDARDIARMLAVAVLVGVAAGCSTTSSAPPASSNASCIAGTVAGTWKDFRMTQLGPAWLTLRLGCDCTYDSTSQLLWMRVNERGRYLVTGSEIAFERASGEATTWPFRLEGESLLLTEAPGEDRTYRRSQRASCD